MEENQRSGATGKMSEDGKTLVVTVPGRPEVAARIRGELRDAFREVLGVERLQAFDDIVGLDFERSFDHFGQNPRDYIVILPVEHAEEKRYSVTDYPHDLDDPKSESWGTSPSTLEQLRKHPTLGQFFPVQAGEETGR